MSTLKNILTALLLSACAIALPQDVPQLTPTTTASVVVSATNTLAAASSTLVSATNTRVLSSTNDDFNSTNPSTASGFVSATNTRFASRTTSIGPTFVGWSSISTRSTTTRFSSAYCSRSSVYVESELSGTTYAGCCDTRNGNNCATTTLAQYCVNNVQMVGNRTIKDCGTSTCAHAVIYQNVGDEERGVSPISFHQCIYYGSRGGTLYRTLPATNAVTRAFYTSTSSSSSKNNNNLGMSSHRIGVIVGVTIVAFLICFVLLPVCVCRARRRRGTGAEGGIGAGQPKPSGRGVYQINPPSVTAPPPYSKESPGEGAELLRPVTLDPGSGDGASSLPRYENVGVAR